MTLVLTTRRGLSRRDIPARLGNLADNEFSGYASLFGVPDGAGDIVERGAFTGSLRCRPPGEVRMLYQHSALEPIGVWCEIKEDARGLFVRGRLVLDVVRAREVRALIREGALNGLSIGFRTRRARKDGAYRRLSEIELWEISVVTFPLLAGSLVTAVGGDATAKSLRAAATRMHLPPPCGEVEARSASGGGMVSTLAPHPIRSLRSRIDLPTRGR